MGLDILIGILTFTVLFQSFKFFKWIKKQNKNRNLLKKLPGPVGVPLLGSAVELGKRGSDYTLDVLIQWIEKYGRRFYFNLGLQPFVLFANAQDAEKILSSLDHIDKTKQYNFFIPWLGLGLLLSRGKKWAQRRKLLTPAFHFKILENFLIIFNEQSKVFVDVLKKFESKGTFEISPYIGFLTLDIICETAMGQKINCQQDTENSYIKAVHKINDLLFYRAMTPWVHPDFIWKLTRNGKEEAKCLNILHSFTDKVIQERKEERKRILRDDRKKNDANNTINFAGKQRLAFLDLLLEAQENNPSSLSDADIREETDTFMFEGQDTTAAALGWTIFLLGNHPQVQAKVHEELNDIFGKDKSRPVTSEDLTRLKYLELCIKESLRLYPSVGSVARQLEKDLLLDSNTVIPAGTSVWVMFHGVHRDPEHFPQPDEFIPERFLPENSNGRHSYAYLPFSAGPRNCIGQKFAMMEEKVILANLLRHYEIKSMDKVEDVKVTMKIITRPMQGFNIQLKSTK